MSGFIGDAVSGLVSSTIGPLFGKLIDLIPDPAERARQAALVQQKLMDADATMIAAQNAINLAEAQNSNIFISGWRPAIGWICAGGLGWQTVGEPVLSYAMAMFGYSPALPVIDSTLLMNMTMALLGLGVMKTVERMGGVSNEGQKPPQTMMVRPARAVLDLPSAPVGQ